MELIIGFINCIWNQHQKVTTFTTSDVVTTVTADDLSQHKKVVRSTSTTQNYTFNVIQDV